MIVKEYACYKNDEFLLNGTVQELANYFGTTRNVIYSIVSRSRHGDKRGLVIVEIGQKRDTCKHKEKVYVAVDHDEVVGVGTAEYLSDTLHYARMTIYHNASQTAHNYIKGKNALRVYGKDDYERLYGKLPDCESQR